MKQEWRKSEKDIYLPKTKPTLIEIPKFKYFTIEGKGNPNDNPDFAKRIGALYALSYAIRMMPKSGFTPEGFFEYTVYPLEGFWSLSEKGIKSKTLDKNEFIYKLMIRQPDFVNEELVKKIYAKALAKNELVSEVKFEEIEDGKCLQMMHIGSFDEETKSFALMEEFLEKNNYQKRMYEHKEIYISDFRKVQASKLKTVLRIFIEEKGE